MATKLSWIKRQKTFVMMSLKVKMIKINQWLGRKHLKTFTKSLISTSFLKKVEKMVLKTWIRDINSADSTKTHAPLKFSEVDIILIMWKVIFWAIIWTSSFSATIAIVILDHWNSCKIISILITLTSTFKIWLFNQKVILTSMLMNSKRKNTKKWKLKNASLIWMGCEKWYN